MRPKDIHLTKLCISVQTKKIIKYNAIAIVNKPGNTFVACKALKYSLLFLILFVIGSFCFLTGFASSITFKAGVINFIKYLMGISIK